MENDQVSRELLFLLSLTALAKTLVPLIELRPREPPRDVARNERTDEVDRFEPVICCVPANRLARPLSDPPRFKDPRRLLFRRRRPSEADRLAALPTQSPLLKSDSSAVW